MYCKKCGTYNSNNALRCKNCKDYLVNQYLYENQHNENIQKNNNENNLLKEEDTNNKQSKNNAKKKSKTKKEKRKKPKKSILNRKEKKNKDKKYKDKSQSQNNDKNNKTEVIVKTGCFTKAFILFLILFIIILLGICIVLGLYIANDKITKMPDVIGLTENDAIKILDDNEITYTIDTNYTSNKVDDNTVIKQSKKIGTYILKTDKVTITIGNYNENKENTTTSSTTIKLNNLIGLTKEEAIKVLNKNKIKYTIEEIISTNEEGYVIDQNPLKNTTINTTTTVTLYISKKNNEITSTTNDTTITTTDSTTNVR